MSLLKPQKKGSLHLKVGSSSEADSQAVTKNPLPASYLEQLPWYLPWVQQQSKYIPDSIAKKVHHYDTFQNTFNEVAREVQSAQNPNIDGILGHLVKQEVIRVNEVDGAWQAAQVIVFSMIGWQTMLYAPSFGTCPPGQLAISDDLDGYSGQAFMKLRQDVGNACLPLPNFLLGYGLMLPRSNAFVPTSPDAPEEKAVEKVNVISSEKFNACLLRSIAKVKIKWVDVISPHLEFDKATNTLFLFRYPSFCAANLDTGPEGSFMGVIHRCAAGRMGPADWASEEDIVQFLQEILLSYRLLFGQDKKCRKKFRSFQPFKGLPKEMHDPILAQLCETCDLGVDIKHVTERETYRLQRDFPILRGKIAVLYQHLSMSKPRSLRQLWRDKRDSAQWYTFWAVILIGGSGVALATIQTALQIAQLATAT